MILWCMERTLRREYGVSYISLLQNFNDFLYIILYTIQSDCIFYSRPILALDTGLCCRFFSRLSQKLLVLTLSKGNPDTKLLLFACNHFAFIYGLAPAAPGKGT